MNGPIRTSYSREELADKLKDWMIQEWGHPKELSEESRDKWYLYNGIVYSFICAHFPLD